MATIGEVVQSKQGKQGVAVATLVTCQPSKKELKKANQVSTPMATARKFVFKIPDLKFPELNFQDATVREATMHDFNQFREKIGPYMYDLVSALRQIEAMKEDERVLAQEDHTAVRAAIERILNDDQPLAREPATVAYANAVFKTCLPSRRAVQDALHDLVEKGFLEESPVNGGKSRAGVKEIYGGGYSLSVNFSRSPEAKKVFAALDGLVNRSVAAGRDYFEARRDAVMALAGPPQFQLSLEDLKAGKPGRRYIPIPFQEWVSRDEKPRFRREGGMTIEVRQGHNRPGMEIIVLDGFGGIENDVAKIVNAGVFVTPAMVGYERLNIRDLPEEQFWAVVSLHRLVRLGIAEAEKQAKIAERKAEFRQQVDAERKALMTKATCTILDFFVGGAVGTALADWGPKPFLLRFRDKNGKPAEKPIWFCFVLVERNELGQIRMADYPERLNEFFVPYREFADPGPDFSTLGKLGVILRRAKETALKGATPEERQAAEKAQAEAKAAREEARVAEEAQQLAAGLAPGEDLSDVKLPPIPTGK